MALVFRSHLPWGAIGILGAVALAIVALERGEHVNALWMVVASILVYLIAYRYYSLFIAKKVMRLDASRPTPAAVHNDGLDYVPTNRYVLFGHHFAAIAGAGPLVGLRTLRLPGARLMVGFPDYDTYVAHIRKTHPDQTPMTYPEFFRERQLARYGADGRRGFRCC